MPKEDLFTASDLFDKKGTFQVLQNIFSLGRHIQNLPNYSLPSLGRRQRSKTLPLIEAPEKLLRQQSSPLPPRQVTFAPSSSSPSLPKANYSPTSPSPSSSSTTTFISIPMDNGEDMPIEKLMKQLAEENKMTATDKRVINTISILKENGFDSLSSLKDVTQEELLAIKIPLFFAKSILKRAQGQRALVVQQALTSQGWFGKIKSVVWWITSLIWRGGSGSGSNKSASQGLDAV
eukprot:TRINITY_DN6264_c0_g1_i1.p1 TRINITY_DN6264_c0_g1~~TRINITY_DN6264_c0_g1_i1.p1  ORF type:complete len:234 (+),score=71.94 TRINITY_DN6264_c0_g1_i1:73-774(+)